MSYDRSARTRRDALKLGRGAAAFAAAGTLPTLARAAAPMLGGLRPQAYRFKLGDFEITNILDGFIRIQACTRPSAATSLRKRLRHWRGPTAFP